MATQLFITAIDSALTIVLYMASSTTVYSINTAFTSDYRLDYTWCAPSTYQTS